MSVLRNFDMELTQRSVKKYQRASKKEKAQLLKDYCILTGVSRNTASKRFRKMIRNPHPRTLSTEKYKRKRGAKKKYREEHKLLIKMCWEQAGKVCGELLHPQLKVILIHLEEAARLNTFSQEAINQCKEISLITLKRIISTYPRSHSKKHKGNIDIYKKVPICANYNKNTDSVGYTALDYVEHNGGNSSGRFLITGTYVDICTQWITRVGGDGKNLTTIEKMHDLYLKRTYHKIVRIHTDNVQTALKLLVDQSEKMNPENRYYVSRSRPYKKNDNAHVEQKNGDKVRKLVGYHRYEGDLCLKYLNELYAAEDLISNFFIPCQKLKYKEHNEMGKLIRRKHDEAKTPYQRMLEQEYLDKEVKRKLTDLYSSLNLVELRDLSNKIRTFLFKARTNYKENEL